MNPLLAITIALAFTFASTAVVSGGVGVCHFHGDTPAVEAVIKACAISRKDTMVEASRLKSPWKDFKLEIVELVEVRNKRSGICA